MIERSVSQMLQIFGRSGTRAETCRNSLIKNADCLEAKTSNSENLFEKIPSLWNMQRVIFRTLFYEFSVRSELWKLQSCYERAENATSTATKVQNAAA